MEFKRLFNTDSPKFEAAWQIYNYSFPYCEIRDLDDHESIMRDDRYHFVVMEREAELVGILGYWFFENSGVEYIYLEHLATSREVRNCGIGRVALDYLKGLNLPILLEIEHPEDELTRRREGFYQRSGFITNVYNHRHSPYHKAGEWVSLKIMSYPAPFSAADYDHFCLSQREIMPCF